MKTLVAYDGSDCSERAVADLGRAGLPALGEILVLSVAEISAHRHEVAAVSASAGYHHPDDRKQESWEDKRLAEAQALAAGAAERLRSEFARGSVTAQAVADLPQAAILATVRSWKPDLVVLGSHGRSTLKRLALGSTAHFVLNHVPCSVRIGRCRSKPVGGPIRIVVGTDGSEGARAVAEVVGQRQWPRDTQVRVVSVADAGAWLLSWAAGVPQTMCIPTVKDELEDGAAEAAKNMVRELKGRGLEADLCTCTGNPGRGLCAEAEQWSADCIFVGARGLNAMGRMVLGSVSTAVALSAPCSVEVVHSSAPVRGTE